MRRSLIVLSLISTAACSDSLEMAPVIDTGVVMMDASTDASITDATATDANTSDSGMTDAMIEDSGMMDSGLDASVVDGGAVCNQTAIAVVTAAEALLQADTLDGEVIVLTGTATSGAQFCTARACPPDNPCCNICNADVVVDAITFASSACFSNVGCRGTECGLVCQPPTLGLPGRYRGIFRAGPPATLEFIGLEP